LQTAKAENPDALRDPAIRERVAELHMQIDFTRLLIARALSKVLKGEKGWPEVPLAKLQWGYISLWLAELALDILGPTGSLLKGSPGAIDGTSGPELRGSATTIGAGPTEVRRTSSPTALKLER
jgi:alkylation response protein AidB-like acyl-CoA dehydrogenase